MAKTFWTGSLSLPPGKNPFPQRLNRLRINTTNKQNWKLREETSIISTAMKRLLVFFFLLVFTLGASYLCPCTQAEIPNASSTPLSFQTSPHHCCPQTEHCPPAACSLHRLDAAVASEALILVPVPVFLDPLFTPIILSNASELPKESKNFSVSLQALSVSTSPPELYLKHKALLI